MDLENIKILQGDQENLSLPFPIKKRRELRSYVSVNDFVPIAIENIASFYDKTTDLPIRKADGTEIGYLYFTKGIEVANTNSLSEPKFICYLIDVPDANTVINSAPYVFQSDYLVVYRQYLIEYIEKYKLSAPIWGLFNHKYSSLLINPPYRKTITQIEVFEFKRFSQDYYYEASVRGIKHSLVFERFLKYYHLLELNFDFDVIERIKKLDTINDSEQISVLLHEYKKDDIERLKYLFYTYCLDVNSIIEKMKSLSSYIPIAKKIFYDFGKESNPLKDYSQFTSVLAKSDGFTLNNCKAVKIQNAHNADAHKKFIGNLCVYWIYRVRNSIAHNKVGEYIMSHRDQEFVVEFAEPLLLEFLKKVFK